jgi:GNAT superfamily N-acetyltransferase
MVQLRTYTVTDAPGCCAVIRACLPLLDGLDDAAFSAVAASLTPDALHAELGSAVALVITDSTGRVLGLGAIDGAELKWLYVLPPRQRQGLGTALLEALEIRARDAGWERLLLEASPGAAGFFRALGYAGEDVVVRRAGEARFRVVPMAKALTR